MIQKRLLLWCGNFDKVTRTSLMVVTFDIIHEDMNKYRVIIINDHKCNFRRSYFWRSTEKMVMMMMQWFNYGRVMWPSNFSQQNFFPKEYILRILPTRYTVPLHISKNLVSGWNLRHCKSINSQDNSKPSKKTMLAFIP